MTDIARLIRDIPDFPKPGIVFKDITPLLADAAAFRTMVDRLVEPYRGKADVVLGVESRGGAAVLGEGSRAQRDRLAQAGHPPAAAASFCRFSSACSASVNLLARGCKGRPRRRAPDGKGRVAVSVVHRATAPGRPRATCGEACSVSRRCP